MAEPTPQPGDRRTARANDTSLSAPAISLPKGGGAIRSMGEKFAANPVTGTGALTLPIATSPGRGGFGPRLALAYDSGAGNGPFGLGWNLNLPAIARKTERGIPRYRDTEDSDQFLLAGAEDLVPVLAENGGDWLREHVAPRTVHGQTYRIYRYRPRVEGLFALIERWINDEAPEDHFWRTISRDNVTSYYGKRRDSRIVDPADPSRIFQWSLSESFDNKGNVIRYEYKPEDSSDIDRLRLHETNRSVESRSANRYLKRIRYGNRTPYLPILTPDGAPTPLPSTWLFEVVFDYGDHDTETPEPAERTDWNCRPDPMSSYRAGFEIRTYRLCQRALMFHHFPEADAQGVGANCLVRSTDFTYRHEQDLGDRRNPIHSTLASVTQVSYTRVAAGHYDRRWLPPLEFDYSAAIIREEVEEVDPHSLENLPYGLDGGQYQWVDLDGEGMSGVLTQQAQHLFYKRNLSPVSGQHIESEMRTARLGPMESVSQVPSLAAIASHQQLVDLRGDGQLDLVDLGGSLPGFYERTHDEGWETFRPFASVPVVRWDDPNVRLVDLTGDGHADVLVTKDDAFTWYPSLAEEGFGPSERVQTSLDEEKGPRLVFADGTQSIYLADLSGDGLTDLVRIRNREVCYWPNLGYGRFGAKVTMDNAPSFDAPDLFDQRRIRLADIDGSGLSDIVYLGSQGLQLYFNQAGNSWSDARTLARCPRLDNLSAVHVFDLLGNGTACVVWSSPLPGETRRTMRYIKLMGDQKPHLLVKTRNNLGSETEIQYAPSTKFYLADRLSGHRWITRLPFPVHVVEKVIVTDKWRNTTFSTMCSYHHGYFDGIEREFRGFGRVDRIDVESFGQFASANEDSPYVTRDKTLYQPPIKTVTWFHTGAFLERERILSQFKKEYFPASFEALDPGERHIVGAFREHELPEPDIYPPDLTGEEWREALRACKGMMLRQETYELDVDALERGEYRPVKLHSVLHQSNLLRRLQPRATNAHPVFVSVLGETVTYHYELDLRPSTLEPDPRVAHTLNLNVDRYGNALETLMVVYPRVGRSAYEGLPPGAEERIAEVQREMRAAYTEIRYTNEVNDSDAFRLPAPCEVMTADLTGISPARRYFTTAELRRFRLSTAYRPDGLPVPEIRYHDIAHGESPQKRRVEHLRTLYFHENLREPLRLGASNALGLTYEMYKLALTDELLEAVFADKLTPEVRVELGNASSSGYLCGPELAARFGSHDATGQYWIRSGIAGFASGAHERFYLPDRYTDSFGNVTTVRYDSSHLYVESRTDPAGSSVAVTTFDYRVLAPRAMRDANHNVSEVTFDILGNPAASAVRGKGAEGDDLDGLTGALLDLSFDTTHRFFTGDFSEAEARRLLGGATVRHLYDFGEERRADGGIEYEHRPASGVSIMRERHVARVRPGDESPLQVIFEYFDATAGALVTKVRAEPESGSTAPRWIAAGKTILNNKAKPVRQYEPYFSESEHRFEEPRETGVSPVMYYDALGRIVRTEFPDGAFSRVAFTPWDVATYDANDTVLEHGHGWYAEHSTAPPGSDERQAAQITAVHANTPSMKMLDSMGREVVSVAHNVIAGPDGSLREDKHFTFSRVDAEGKPLWLRDARQKLAMQYVVPPAPANEAADPASGFVPGYDLAGTLLFQHSMDAGDRWMLSDAAGQPFYTWDVNDRVADGGSLTREQRLYHTTYDLLRRPLQRRLQINGGAWHVLERFAYGETVDDPDRLRNLRGQLYQHDDASGRVRSERYDFKGNLLESAQQLISNFAAPIVDWSDGSSTARLDAEIFSRLVEYDALNRVERVYAWHRVPDRVTVYEPRYNLRGLLGRQDVVLRATRTEAGYAGGVRTAAVADVRYDARAQRQRIEYGNGAATTYEYDPQTFRVRRLETTRPHPDSGRRKLQDLQYTYDPVGNITAIRDTAQQAAYFDNTAIEAHGSFRYDALYRLISATGREHAVQNNVQRDGEDAHAVVGIPFPNSPEALQRFTEEYDYDAVGNILRMRHIGGSAERWTRRYQYAEDSNRLNSTSAPGDEPGVFSTRYEHDLHGNMLTLDRTAAEFRLRWDHRDMVQAQNRGGGGWVFYNYSAGKQRTRKVGVNGSGRTEWERVYLEGMELYRRHGSAGATEEIETFHVFVDDQRALIVDDVLTTSEGGSATGPRYRYQLGTHLGSASVELDERAEVISQEEFHPYGTTAYRAGRTVSEVSAKRYRYSGMERDTETGLSYHAARYYAPWLGRWISVDPSGISAGMNLYLYSFGNPVNYTDVSGKEPITICIGIGILIGIGVAWALTPSPAAAPAEELTPTEVSSFRTRERQAWTRYTIYSAAAGANVTSLPALAGVGASAEVTARFADDVIAGEASSVEEYATDAIVGAAGVFIVGGLARGSSALLRRVATGVLTDASQFSLAQLANAADAGHGLYVAARQQLVAARLALEAAEGPAARALRGAVDAARRQFREIQQGYARVREAIRARRAAASAERAAPVAEASGGGDVGGGGDGGGGVPGGGSPGSPGGGGAQVVSPVFRFAGRDIVVVETSAGRQALYRSTGESSGRPGAWLPFDEIVPHLDDWFNKWRFTEEAGIGEGSPMYRLGTEELARISDEFGRMDLPSGGELVDAFHVNTILDFFRSAITRFNLVRPVPH